MQFHATARTKRLVLAASIAAAFGAFAAPALSADMETILEKMHEKGLLTEEEYQEMRSEAREERRKEALKEATAEEKAAKAKEEEPATLKGRFRDGFTLESGDKQHSISISGRIHADYRSFSEDDATATARSADTFDVRRAYFGVSGKIYEDWTFEVTSDVANSSLEYAYVNYKSSDLLQFRVGAFKMPFSFEELTSSRFVDFQERSLVNAFVPAKDQGLMIYGEPVKNTFAYAVAAMNGATKNVDEANAVVDDKEIIVRAAVNFAPMAGLANTVLHLGGGYTTGTLPGNTTLASNVRTEGRGIAFFTASAPGSATDETDRERLGLEGVAAWGPIKLQTEWVQSSFENSTAAYDRDIDAYYAALSWMITGEKYSDNYTLNGMRAIKPNNPYKKGGGGTGAWELGVRFSKLDAGDLTAGQFSGTNEADAITVGLKWIPVTPVRFYLNYTQTDFDTPIAVVGGTADSEKAITLRASVFF